MPSDGAEANGGVVFANFMKFKDRTPSAGEHYAAFSDTGFDFLVPARQSIGHRNDAYVGFLHPIQIETCTENFVALEIGHFFP